MFEFYHLFDFYLNRTIAELTYTTSCVALAILQSVYKHMVNMVNLIRFQGSLSILSYNVLCDCWNYNNILFMSMERKREEIGRSRMTKTP